MSKKAMFAVTISGLVGAAVFLSGLVSFAQDRPPIKSPAPIRPLPPAKPNDPLKPLEPAKPRTPPKEASAQAPGSMPDKSTRAALAKKVSLDLTDVPLQDVIAAIAKQTQLDIEAMAKDATIAGQSEPDSKVTIHLSGIEASSALDLVAHDLGWKWFAEDGAVLLTNDSLPVVSEVYNVRDLVLAHPGGGDDETLDYDYSALTDVITGSLPSPTWVPDSSLVQDCTPFHGTLTINQDQKVQDRVIGFLAALRKSRDLAPQQYDAAVRAGLSVDDSDKAAAEAVIDAALAKNVAAQPTAVKLDDLADWIRKTYSIPVHIDAHARDAGWPATAVADASAVPDSKAKVDAIGKPETANPESAKPDPAPAKPGASAKPGTAKPQAAAKSEEPPKAVSPAESPSVVNMPLRDALEELFADSKLAFTVRDEVLVITTKDDQMAERVVRVYPVGDLIGGDVDKDGVDDDYSRLLDSITRSVQPDSWLTLDKAKSGTAYASYLPQGRAIVCTHTRAAQVQVAEILAKIRKAIEEQGPKTSKASTTDSSPVKDAASQLRTKIYKLNPDLPADDFVTVIKDLVEPASWKLGDAYIHGVPGAIIVKQTGTIQKRVEKMLIDLGAIPDPKKNPPSGTPTLVGRRKAI
jgi:hypothetical protein